MFTVCQRLLSNVYHSCLYMHGLFRANNLRQLRMCAHIQFVPRYLLSICTHSDVYCTSICCVMTEVLHLGKGNLLSRHVIEQVSITTYR